MGGLVYIVCFLVFLFLHGDVFPLVFGGEFHVLDEKFLYGGIFSQSFEQDVYFIAFLFQFVFPVPGDVILGMVSGHEHEGYQGHFFCLIRFEFADYIIHRGVTFDRSHVVVLVSLGFHHVVEHPVG